MAKIKICGLTRPEDIQMVNRTEPDYVGFVFAESRRQVSIEQAAVLRAHLRPGICPVGVFVNEEEDQICQIVEHGMIEVVQLHGQETPEQVRRLRQRLNRIPIRFPYRVLIMKAICMEPGHELDRWLDSEVDFLLLDTGSGGTGTTFDHELIARAGQITKPWFLAGGMNPDNAKDAIERFHPYGIDVSSGVEIDGRKNNRKIESMIRSVRDE